MAPAGPGGVRAGPGRGPRPPLLPPESAPDRSGWAASILAHVVRRRPGASRTTDAIDRVVLHPVAGTLLFAAVMVTFFQLIFAWAQPAMGAIDAGVGQTAALVRSALPPGL